MEQCERCAVTVKKVLVAHHIDMNRNNNNLSNLIWLCRNCHFIIHNYPHERVLFYGLKRFTQ